MVRDVADRDLSIVVFGATGVTGRRTAAYLAERAAELGVRWAVAGRDAAKLERVLGEVGVMGAETLIADVGEPESLAAMASRTRVVLNLVGPYTLYSEPVIEACIGNGAHYADLTGEMPFARRMIDAYQERAVAAGVKVVQASGFEALPPDLAVLLATETARERWGEDLAEAELEVSMQAPKGLRPADVVSGGTMQGTAEVLGAEGAANIADPAVLITDPEVAAEVRRRSPISLAPRRNAGGDVIAPMTPAAFINPAIVQRTAALIAAEQSSQSEPLRYREGVAIPGGTVSLPFRYAAAAALAGTQVGFRALARTRPAIRERVAGALRRALPSSGFGPSGSRLEDWSWQMTLDARSAGDHRLRVEVDADGHPGYLATSRMLGEAGLLLAEDGATPQRAGFLTPAAALGTAHLDRFERAGVRFSLSSSDVSADPQAGRGLFDGTHGR
jgi:short subunit dehydrogenase-like uncharacterized protein